MVKRLEFIEQEEASIIGDRARAEPRQGEKLGFRGGAAEGGYIKGRVVVRVRQWTGLGLDLG